MSHIIETPSPNFDERGLPVTIVRGRDGRVAMAQNHGAP